ncbi:MAG TPA: alpha/beta hydrolase [archaeon]|nr:alpha/beta hydrolase [archaeon]
MQFEDNFVLVDSANPNPTPLSEESKQFITYISADYKAAMNGFIKLCIPEPNCRYYHRWGLDICLRAKPEAAVRLIRLFEGADGGNAEYSLSDITVPTLVIHGSKDVITPLESGKYLANKIPNAELVVIEGAGHVPTITYPYEVVEAIEHHFKP